MHNFVQSIFNSLEEETYKNKTLVVSGDGRFWNDTAIQVILSVAAGNQVSKVVVGENGLLSTPCVSKVIRTLNKDDATVCAGGILLTASHNPGGEDEDWGIKFNTSNGGPALENLTEAIFEHTKKITEYQWTDLPEVDVSQIGV